MLQYTPLTTKGIIIRRTCILMDHGLRVAYIAAQILKKTGENDFSVL